jgi:PTS system mannose-specific IIA component
MIGIFLVTHGTLGEALIQCAATCSTSARPSSAARPVGAGRSRSTPCRRRQMLGWVDSGEGVLLLTDIYGATPATSPPS